LINLTDFTRFCTDKFDLRLKAQGLFEPRKRPEIPISRLFLLIVGALALRKQSFHQIDLFARHKGAKKWLGTGRPMVASDATLWRVLPQMNRSELRGLVHQAYRLLRKKGQGRLSLPSGRKIRAAAVDGTVWGQRYASAVEMVGESPVVLDFEPSPGQGHELAASEAVLRRTFEQFRDLEGGLADIVLGDGLYFTEKMLKLCRQELRTHLLVKTTELDSLLVLKDAEALFNASGEMAHDIERHRGIDAARGISYEIWAASGFEHGEFGDPLKVARVRIQPLKGNEAAQTFWVITTDTTLSGSDMRELAHRRWEIENHGFRALNEAMNSKHVWTRGKNSERTFEALMLMMILSFMLVVAYHSQVDPETLWEKFRLRRLTFRQLAEEWLMTLYDALPLWADAS
jgi:ribosomal protein S14